MLRLVHLPKTRLMTVSVVDRCRDRGKECLIDRSVDRGIEILKDGFKGRLMYLRIDLSIDKNK